MNILHGYKLVRLPYSKYFILTFGQKFSTVTVNGIARCHPGLWGYLSCRFRVSNNDNIIQRRPS